MNTVVIAAYLYMTVILSAKESWPVTTPRFSLISKYTIVERIQLSQHCVWKVL